MDRFDAEQFARLAQARGLELGGPLTYSAVTGSTSDDALEAARAGAPHGALFVADEQTRGRGRRGRQWCSAAGAGLLFSLLLRPCLSPAHAPAITLAVGLAVRDAVAPHVTAPVRLRWPNDIVIDRRKLAGILVESQTAGAQPDCLVVGVGLNVHGRELPPELHDTATSLALLGAERVAREALLVELLAALQERLRTFAEAGLAPMLPELARHDALLGQRVRAGEVVGVAHGIDAAGALQVQGPDGRRHHVTSGSVELA